MTDNIYIDDINLRGRFGCWVTKGGYNGLLAYPAMKEPETNDWPEEDGIEVDLSDPKLEPKEATISFLSDTNGGATDPIAYLSEPGYHTVRIPSLGREWQLRLSSHPANKVYPLATSFSLKFVEDNPVRPASEGLPSPGVWMSESRYKLDDVPLAGYGVVVDESRNALLKAPTVKMNLSREIMTEDGRIYDADHLVYQKKEVTFKCHLKAARIADFWQCYDSFLSALIQPGERQLYVEEIGKAYPCYYKSASAWKLLTLCGPVVAQFDLTLVFTSFRLYETDYFLATEAGAFILTEDGSYYINMK